VPSAALRAAQDHHSVVQELRACRGPLAARVGESSLGGGREVADGHGAHLDELVAEVDVLVVRNEGISGN